MGKVEGLKVREWLRRNGGGELQEMQKVGTMHPIQIPSPVKRGRDRVGARESTPSRILTAAHGDTFTALFAVVSDHPACCAPSLTLPRFAGEGIKRAANTHTLWRRTKIAWHGRVCETKRAPRTIAGEEVGGRIENTVGDLGICK